MAYGTPMAGYMPVKTDSSEESSPSSRPKYENPEDEHRYRQKRDRNNEAAKKSRKQRKAREEQAVQAAQRLEQEKQELLQILQCKEQEARLKDETIDRLQKQIMEMGGYTTITQTYTTAQFNADPFVTMMGKNIPAR
ncbi:unnamed protein product, partial [Mesorhabditis spiculigera]